MKSFANRLVPPLCLLSLLVASGCVQRSMVFGQNATLLDKGASEVTASPGIYSTVTSEANETDDSETRFVALGVEAGMRHGLSESLNLDLHFSNAGAQLGLKIPLASSVALMPQVGGGLWLTTTEDSAGSSSTVWWNVVGGAKLLFGTGAFYGGLGGELQHAGEDDRGETRVHGLAALGREWRTESLALRLELSIDATVVDESVVVTDLVSLTFAR